MFDLGSAICLFNSKYLRNASCVLFQVLGLQQRKKKFLTLYLFGGDGQSTNNYIIGQMVVRSLKKNTFRRKSKVFYRESPRKGLLIKGHLNKDLKEVKE